jgi:GNAT superfamily N-acetyltransferase
MPEDFPELYDDNDWDNCNSWVCTKDSKIVGAIGLRHRSLGVIEISFFFVSQHERKAGVGSRLYALAYDWLLQSEHQSSLPFVYTSIWLLTLQDIYDDACRFYEKKGFILVDRVVTEHYTHLYYEKKLIFEDSAN